MLKRFFALIAIGALIAGSFAITQTHAAKHASASTTAMSLKLASVGLSGAVGTATFTYDATSDMSTVKLMVKNLVAMSSHPAHIHTGKCGQNTPVVAALASVVAGSNGVGTSTTMIKGSWAHKLDHINVHYGPGLTLTQYTVISCANLK